MSRKLYSICSLCEGTGYLSLPGKDGLVSVRDCPGGCQSLRVAPVGLTEVASLKVLCQQLPDCADGEEYAARLLPDGRRLSVIPISFSRARLCLAPAHNHYVYDRIY